MSSLIARAECLEHRDGLWKGAVVMFATVLSGIGSCGDDHMSGGWWWVMGIGWLVFLAAVAAIVYAFTRGHHTPPVTGASAHDILAERFARGEIDAEEYRARSDVLRG